MPYTSVCYLYALGWYQMSRTLPGAYIHPAPHSLQRVYKHRNAELLHYLHQNKTCTSKAQVQNARLLSK